MRIDPVSVQRDRDLRIGVMRNAAGITSGQCVKADNHILRSLRRFMTLKRRRAAGDYLVLGYDRGRK